MDTKEVGDNIRKLAQLYADAAWTYERAIDKIDQEDMREDLLELRDRHLFHFERLSDHLKNMGELPPRYGIPGELSQGLRSITDDMKDDDVIRTLRANEHFITDRIRDLEENVQIPEINEELEEELDDEQMYMSTLDDMMS